MSDETKVMTPEQARLLVRAVRSRHSEGHPEYGAMYCGLCADCWPCSAEDAAAAVESLAAQVERYRALLLDVAASGVEYSDPRIDYCTVQVDTDTWREVRAIAEEAAR